MKFRDLLNELDEEDKVEHIGKEVSPEYEITRHLKKTDDVLLFENVANHDIRVVGNLFGSRKRIAQGIEAEQDGLIDKMRNSLSQSSKPEIVSEGPVKEIVEEDVDLKNIPILEHFEKDGGPYVTSSIFVAKDSEGKRNLSFHRLMLIGSDEFAIRLVPRNLYKMFTEAERREEPLEVAAVIGADPSVAIAAASSPSYEIDEYGIANNLSENLELMKCHSVDLEVPSHAEIVLEGKLLPGRRVPEGPFADITGTYDAVREQPVFKVDVITRRKDSIYHALLPGSPEHQFLMGIPREPLIFEEVDKVAEIKNAVLTPGGCGWLHGVISIAKKENDDGKESIEAAFRAHPSIKHVVVVDDDIDIYNSQDIEWAIATRFRADEDAVVKSNVEGSSLDPTADAETRLGCKMGIDATKDLEDVEKFERAKIPDEEE